MTRLRRRMIEDMELRGLKATRIKNINDVHPCGVIV